MTPKLALISLATLAFTATTNAAVMTLYSGPDCTGSTQDDVNVWDNTCATWISGFQSFKMTYPGGLGQVISTYSPNACAGGTYQCTNAGNTDICFNSFGDNFSGSNAISSGTSCGIAKRSEEWTA